MRLLALAAAACSLSSCININPPPTSVAEAPPEEVQPGPPAPSGSRPTPVAEPGVEFHLQLSPQDQILGAKGLGRTIRYPQPGTDVPVYTGKVGIVYEWRPKDGLEDRVNARTGKDWGPIWKETVAEQMLPDNLQRHLDTVEQWVGTYVPKDFEGVVALDLERWPLKSDTFHMSKKDLEDLARLAPGKTQAELMGRFMTLTEERVRRARPRVTGWGWWSMGAIHPGFLVWHADKYKAWKEGGVRAEQEAVAGSWIPFPSFYFPTTYPDAGTRRLIWPKLREQWTLLYGAERLRGGYAYLNVRHSDKADPPLRDKPVTREQFHECVEAAWEAGIRRFVIWDAIASPQIRDTDQKFIDEILVPEARYWAERARAERAAGAP